MILRFILLAIGYLFGLFQTGYIFGKAKNMDIRQHGSGNAGATNTLRVMGVKAGATVFFGDLLKCLIPCLIVRLIFRESDYKYIYLLYMGLGVVLGHIFPFYLGFKGGKGVASTAGILLALDLRITLVCLIVFVLTVAITRYVSLASILVMISFSLMSIFYSSAKYEMIGDVRTEFIILCLTVALISIYKHKSNIKRLIKGTENKIGKRG